jgi:hypothetical protein
MGEEIATILKLLLIASVIPIIFSALHAIAIK